MASASQKGGPEYGIPGCDSEARADPAAPLLLITDDQVSKLRV